MGPGKGKGPGRSGTSVTSVCLIMAAVIILLTAVVDFSNCCMRSFGYSIDFCGPWTQGPGP